MQSFLFLVVHSQSWWLINLSWPSSFHNIPFFMFWKAFFSSSTHRLCCKINPWIDRKPLRRTQGQVRWCWYWRSPAFPQSVMPLWGWPSFWRNSRRSQSLKVCLCTRENKGTCATQERFQWRREKEKQRRKESLVTTALDSRSTKEWSSMAREGGSKVSRRLLAPQTW